MRTLLIDNHDSYTYNLFQLMAELDGTEPVVVSNDDPSLATRRPATRRLGAFDGIVISPGPGRPQVSRDLGHVLDVLARTDLPVLGVCLGHQAIAHAAGAVVTSAPRPRHGHLTRVKHTGDELFVGVPSEFVAVRYHSLCVKEPLPDVLEATAWSEDGVVMALRHRELPRWGVQFHPESIATEHGREILANFRQVRLRHRSARSPRSVLAPTSVSPVVSPVPSPVPSTVASDAARPTETATAGEGRAPEIVSAVVPRAVDPEAVFVELFASAPTCFWLDSSRVEPGLARFSFLGDASGPFSEVLTYRVGSGAVRVRDAAGERVEQGSVFDVLDRRLRERRMPDPGLPFDLSGGYVGYFGYEMKAECGGLVRHRAPSPDAAWIFADRLIAVDHEEGRTYVLALHDGDKPGREGADTWTRNTAALLETLPDLVGSPPDADVPEGEPVPVALPERDRDRYVAAIEECRRQLVRGESYEICLTDTIRLPFHDDETAFYRRLRRLNPAPYAALLRVAGVTVFSSSPERFLRIERHSIERHSIDRHSSAGHRMVESKPIKGTAPRSDDPTRDAELAAGLAGNPKTRAENLMIVDLLRNDLGQVCEVGSVRVDRYMAVESYATVHQLVSTIRGRLSPEVSAVECVRRCFPGGSMTGAPKQRTMEIIDKLECGPRGVYSGALGYFGLSGGADLAVVIRTAVRTGDEISVGAGGAIVLDSDPDEELDEMLLKAAAPLRAWRPGGSARCVGSVCRFGPALARDPAAMTSPNERVPRPE